jgi:hypothetical protein
MERAIGENVSRVIVSIGLRSHFTHTLPHYSCTCWKAKGRSYVEWFSLLGHIDVGLECDGDLLQTSKR